MSYKPFTVALFAVWFLAFAVQGYAIEADQVIDPKGNAVSQTENTSGALDGILSGGQAKTGAIVSFLGFAVVLGGLAVVLWYLFKRGVIRKPFVKGDGKLNIAETRMLGNRQFIMVVEYEGQKILLGVGPGKIDYLTNLNSYRGEFASVEPAQFSVSGGSAQ